MTLVVRQGKALAIARMSTSLQIAVAGETLRPDTQPALDGPKLAGELAALALDLKDELEEAQS